MSLSARSRQCLRGLVVLLVASFAACASSQHAVERPAPVAGLVTMGIGLGLTAVSAASFDDCSSDGAEDLCGIGNIGPTMGLVVGGSALAVGAVVTAIQVSARRYEVAQAATRVEPPGPVEPTFSVTPTGAALTW
ncbi:MAG: hypothetical protein H6745_08415 [Deltaproteobacteria bacterium]|nr:hypothetical protein [Deltaproteobacteria bacterium]